MNENNNRHTVGFVLVWHWRTRVCVKQADMTKWGDNEGVGTDNGNRNKGASCVCTNKRGDCG